MKLPVIVLGGGGHAKVLIDMLLGSLIEVLGYTDVNVGKQNNTILGVSYLGADEVIFRYSPDSVRLVNGLGSVSDTARRKHLYQLFVNHGYQFANVIHPSVVIASDAELSEGVQIMAGSIIQPGCFIGENTIINTKSSIDHDCHIESHVHIAPGVTLSGNVHVGESTHIGTGATIIQDVKIGKGCLIGAGALVLRDIPDNTVALGVPAREVSK